MSNQTRLNVSSDHPDAVLASVQERITSEVKVGGPATFAGKLSAAGTATADRTLDLVSHSWGRDHLLLLGYPEEGAPDVEDTIEASFVIEDDADSSWMDTLVNAKLRQTFGITELRLLGCVTAWSNHGRSTMKRLKERLGMDRVWGTKTLLFLSDFDKDGFIDDQMHRDMLVNNESHWKPPSDDLPLREDALGVETFDIGKVPALPLVELEKLIQLKDSKGVMWPLPRSRLMKFGREDITELHESVGIKWRSEGRSLPGLLASPSREFWIPALDTPDRYQLMQILFDWQMVCVYSPNLVRTPNSKDYFANHAIYRIADPKRCKALMMRPENLIPISP